MVKILKNHKKMTKNRNLFRMQPSKGLDLLQDYLLQIIDLF